MHCLYPCSFAFYCKSTFMSRKCSTMSIEIKFYSLNQADRLMCNYDACISGMVENTVIPKEKTLTFGKSTEKLFTQLKLEPLLFRDDVICYGLFQTTSVILCSISKHFSKNFYHTVRLPKPLVLINNATYIMKCACNFSGYDSIKLLETRYFL